MPFAIRPALRIPSLRRLRGLAAACLSAGLVLVGSPAAATAADIAWVWFSSDAPPAFEEIAVLVKNLHFSGERIEIRPRLRALEAEPSAKVTPTVHVHLDLARPPRLGPRHADAIASALRAAARQSTSRWVQLDFEALDSQQPFYVDLVKKLRAGLPATIKLSVTVRAGWCDKPELLDKLAADEVVPMFFRMGEAADGYRERLTANPDSLAPRCRSQAVGLAKQEPLPAHVSARYQRRYWFNYRNWNDTRGG